MTFDNIAPLSDEAVARLINSTGIQGIESGFVPGADELARLFGVEQEAEVVSISEKRDGE